MNASPLIEALLIHPPFNRAYLTTEHPEGELEFTGDALGCDCIVVAVILGKGFRSYSGDGERNEDWFGWQADVLAPCDGVVERVQAAIQTNHVGQPSSSPPGLLVFLRADGVRVMYAHVDSVIQEPGDRVHAGERVAVLSNNGYSWYPHLHIGAWRDDIPLQIRFDLRALGRLRAEDVHRYYGTSP